MAEPIGTISTSAVVSRQPQVFSDSESGKVFVTTAEFTLSLIADAGQRLVNDLQDAVDQLAGMGEGGG